MILSIIVPVYNVEKYIQCCIKTLYSPFVDESLYEVIIVNDGTRDDSIHIIEPILSTHKNSRVINQVNQGLSSARNTGFKHSNGEYVWFVDSDDWLVENGIKIIIETILSNSDVDIFTSPLKWCYPNSELDFIDINITEDKKISGINYIKTFERTGAIQRNIIRRSLLSANNVSFYPGILHEDALYGLQIFYLADKVYVLSRSIYNYRQRDDSIMHSLKIKSAYDLVTVHKQLMEFCKSYVKEKDRKWFSLNSLGVINTAVSFTWHLKSSPEFKRFIEDTRLYRFKQAFRNLLYCKNINEFKLVIMCFFPILYRKLLHIIRR